MNKKTAIQILEVLEHTYPDAKCELDFKTPFQLIVATILSAQSTDKTVNKVTKDLFENYPDLNTFLQLQQFEIEDKIKKIGIYRNKAKNLFDMCRMLKIFYNGQIPSNREELMKLPGVGRKTANVVLSNAFNIPAFAVDTHVFRVSNRIGLVSATNVDAVEKQFTELIPASRWILSHHLLIWHGRRICMARAPKCSICPINELCNFYKVSQKDK
jgi:endonuclease-3